MRTDVKRGLLDVTAVGGLIAIGVVLPFVVAAVGGVLFVPHHDDFAYRRAAESLYQTGSLQLTGWSVMTLVGQLAFTLPFQVLLGRSDWAIVAAGVGLGVILIVSSYSLARQVLSVAGATFSVLVLLAVPGLLRNVAAFMTDVPAMAAEMLCLALAAGAIARPDAPSRWRWLIASLAAGVWAFSIREFAIAAPVAVLISAAAADPGRRVKPYVLAGLAVGGACALVYVFSRSVPGAAAISINLLTGWDRVVDWTATLAFFLVPALILHVARARRAPRASQESTAASRRRAIAGAGIAIALGTVLWADDIATALAGPVTDVRVLIGTLLARPGEPSAQVILGTRTPLFPDVVWRLMNLTAVAAAFVGLVILGSRVGHTGTRDLAALDPRRRPSRTLGSVAGLLAIFAVLLAIETVVVGSLTSIFDRYAWPLVLPLTVLLFHARLPPDAPAATESAAQPPGKGGRLQLPAGALAGAGLAVAALAASGSISVAMLANSVAFDAARWRLGQELVAGGAEPMAIDAGFEWLGQHASGTARLTAPLPERGTRYSRLWAEYRRCFVLSVSALRWPDLELVEERRQGYRTFLVAGRWLPLFVYRWDCQPATGGS